MLAIYSSLFHSAKANLIFEQTVVEVTAKPGQQEISVVFRFSNTSGNTVQITKHASACACISASFVNNKKIFSNGEKGSFKAIFKLNKFSGTLEKRIFLWQKGDAHNRPSIRLTAKITIPELISVTPSNLSWNENGASSEQICRLIVNHSKPINITRVSSSNRNFSAKVEIIREGWEYKLTIKPKSTGTPTVGIIKIKTDSRHPRLNYVQVCAYVRASKRQLEP